MKTKLNFLIFLLGLTAGCVNAEQLTMDSMKMPKGWEKIFGLTQSKEEESDVPALFAECLIALEKRILEIYPDSKIRFLLPPRLAISKSIVISAEAREVAPGLGFTALDSSPVLDGLKYIAQIYGYEVSVDGSIVTFVPIEWK